MSIEWAGVAFDEGHQAKNPLSARGRAALAARVDAAGLRLVMTGTPMPNRTEELIQLLVLTGVLDQPGSAMTSEWFKDRYCKRETPESRAELARFLRSTCMVRRNKDVLCLPPKTRDDVWVGLAPRARQLYDNIAVTGLREIRANRRRTLTLFSALRQATAWVKVDTAVGMAVETLAGTSESVVMFAHHTDVQAMIVARLEKAGYPCARLLGGQKDGEAQKAAFQTAGTCQRGYAGTREAPRVIVCSNKAAGTGHTLTRATEMIIAEPEFVPGDNWQIEDRIHRLGQERPVRVRYVLARDTADEWAYDLVASKTAGIVAVVDGIAGMDCKRVMDHYVRRLEARYGYALRLAA